MRYFEKSTDPVSGATISPVSGNAVRTRVNLAPGFQDKPTASVDVPSCAAGQMQVAIARTRTGTAPDMPWPDPAPLTPEPPVFLPTPSATPKLKP